MREGDGHRPRMNGTLTRRTTVVSGYPEKQQPNKTRSLNAEYRLRN
jgi:hypothetical protein